MRVCVLGSRGCECEGVVVMMKVLCWHDCQCGGGCGECEKHIVVCVCLWLCWKMFFPLHVAMCNFDMRNFCHIWQV